MVLKPTGASDGLLTFVGRGFNFVNSDFRLPHIDQFSIGIQRALSSRAKFVEDASFRDCNYMLGGNLAVYGAYAQRH